LQFRLMAPCHSYLQTLYKPQGGHEGPIALNLELACIGL